MPRLVPIAVALLAIVTGCTGGPVAPGATDAQPSSTIEAPTATEAPTDTATPEDATDELNGTLAPGVAADGVENASALLEAHITELGERGFELRVERRTDYEGETYGTDRRITAAARLDTLAGTATRELPAGEAHQRTWLDESTDRLLVRIDADDETRYRIPPVGPAGSDARDYYASEVADARVIAELLRGGEFAVIAVDESDGERRYTLVGANFSTEGSYAERDVSLTVDGDGVIHRLTANGSLTNGGSFAYDARVERLGVESVAQPDWVASAPEPIDTRPTAGFENCTSPYLTLENEGPDAVPAGSVVTVTLNDTEYRVTLEAALGTEDRRALYLDPAGELRVADTDAVPANRTAMPNEAQIVVETGDGLLLVNGAMGFGCEYASEGESESGSSGSGSTAEGSGGE